MANADGRTMPGTSGQLPEERRMAAWVGKALIIQGKIKPPTS